MFHALYHVTQLRCHLRVAVSALPREKIGRTALLLPLLLLPASGCSGGGGGSEGGVGRSEIAIGDGPGSVQISWSSPTTQATGARLAEEVGFRIYHRQTSGAAARDAFEIVPVGVVNGVAVHGLEAGEHEFTVTAVTGRGAESDQSPSVLVSIP